MLIFWKVLHIVKLNLNVSYKVILTSNLNCLPHSFFFFCSSSFLQLDWHVSLLPPTYPWSVFTTLAVLGSHSENQNCSKFPYLNPRKKQTHTHTHWVSFLDLSIFLCEPTLSAQFLSSITLLLNFLLRKP